MLAKGFLKGSDVSWKSASLSVPGGNGKGSYQKETRLSSQGTANAHPEKAEAKGVSQPIGASLWLSRNTG